MDFVQSRHHSRPRHSEETLVGGSHKDKISRLVADIQSLVHELWELLNPWRQDDLLDSTEIIGFQLVALNNKFDQLSSVAEAFNALRRSSALPGTPLEAISISAEVKALAAGLDEAEVKSTGVPSRQGLLRKLGPLSQLKLANFQPLKQNETMGLAEHDGAVVFVERKPIDRMLRSKILPRAESLAALLYLPEGETFRSFVCKGIVEDDGMLSFVFDHPTPDQPHMPRSLLELLSSKTGLEPPSLTVRIQLALRIAQLVQSFHRTGWLHKNIRSENIPFLPSSNSTDPATILEHAFLAGFYFARGSAPQRFPNNLLQTENTIFTGTQPPLGNRLRVSKRIWKYAPLARSCSR